MINKFNLDAVPSSLIIMIFFRNTIVITITITIVCSGHFYDTGDIIFIYKIYKNTSTTSEP
jgi:hypothetical protein